MTKIRRTIKVRGKRSKRNFKDQSQTVSKPKKVELKEKVNKLNEYKSKPKSDVKIKKEPGFIQFVKDNLIASSIAYTIALGSITYFATDKFVFSPKIKQNLAKIEFLEGRQQQNNIVLKKLEEIVIDFQSKEKGYISDIENLNSNVQEKSTSVESLNQEIKRISGINEELDSQVKDLTKQQKQYLADLAAAQKKNKDLTVALNTFKEKATKLQTKMEKLEESNTKYLSSIKNLSGKLQKTAHSKTSLENKLTEVKNINNQLAKQNDTMAAELKQNKQQLAKLNNKKSNKHLAKAKAKTKLTATSVRKLEKKLAKVKLDIESESKLLDTKKALIGGLKLECQSGTDLAKAKSCSNYNKVRDELRNIERKLTFMKAKKSSLTSRLSKL